MIEITRQTAVEFLKGDSLRHVYIPLSEAFEDGTLPAVVMADSAKPTAVAIAPPSAGDYKW